MPTEHEISQGDCIDSIALRYGFFPDTLWNHGANAALKQLRKDPNVLFPGDKLVIPDLELKEESGGTEKKHRFRREGVPAKLNLRFLKPKEPPPEDESATGGGSEDGTSYDDPEPKMKAPEMEPIANAPYRLNIEGQITDGTTDGDGMVKVSIPPNAATGSITFYPGEPEERVIPLALGEMDPVDTIVGARKRLTNLGYPCPGENEMTPELKDVLARFQKDHDLEPDGELNDATKNKLKEKHGC